MAFWTISIVILGALGLEWIVERLRARYLVAAVLTVAAIATTVDTYRYAHRFITPRAAADRFVQELPFSVTPGGRVLSVCENHVFSLELVALGIPTVDGYNPYFLAGMARFASNVRHTEPRQLYMSFPRIGESDVVPDLSLLNLMNVTEVIACETNGNGRLVLESEHGPLLAYRNTQAAGRVVPLATDELQCPAEPSGTGGNVAAFAAGAYRGDRFDGRVRVNVVMPTGGPLLLSEPYYPSRRAAVDGMDVPIARVFDALSAICVGPGAHTVELRYDASRIELGAALTLLTAIVWIAAARRGGSSDPPRAEGR
jgi:hypothetical protein